MFFYIFQELVRGPEFILVEFSYDPLGRRISKTSYDFIENTHTTIDTFSYLYTGEELLSQTKNGVTSLFISSLQDTDDILAKLQSGNISYFHKDHLGSIVAITNNSGNIVAEYSYDAFGNVQNISGDAEFENTLLYTGREYDKEIGLYFYRARYYSPELGRFISQDPIGIEDDINLYAYVGNNPVNFTDPSGEKAKEIFRDPLSENTKARFEGAGKIGIGALESIGGYYSAKLGTQICRGSKKSCIIGSLLVAYGVNYGISGASYMGGGLNQLVTGERNDVHFNLIHEGIEWGLGEGKAADYTKLGVDILAIGAGIRNAPKVVDEVTQITRNTYQAGKEALENTSQALDNLVQPQLAGNFNVPLPKSTKTADDLAMQSAGKSGGGTSELGGTTAKLVDGYYYINGFKFSKYYYEKLWTSGGRKAPSLIAREVLEGATTRTKDSLEGFYRYEYGGWEMIYNPTTTEVWHLLQLKK